MRMLQLQRRPWLQSTSPAENTDINQPAKFYILCAHGVKWSVRYVPSPVCEREWPIIKHVWVATKGLSFGQ